MEAGGRPEFGVCAAVDVHYLSTGGARAATVLAADALAYVLAERTAPVPRVPPYRPAEFFLREIPPLRAVLADLRGLGVLVADRYADLDPGGRHGLGAYAHAEFGIPVIGVAKSRFRIRDPRGPGPARVLVAPAICHCGRDAHSRGGGPGSADGRPVPAARRTAPR